MDTQSHAGSNVIQFPVRNANLDLQIVAGTWNLMQAHYCPTEPDFLPSTLESARATLQKQGYPLVKALDDARYWLQQNGKDDSDAVLACAD